MGITKKPVITKKKSTKTKKTTRKLKKGGSKAPKLIHNNTTHLGSPATSNEDPEFSPLSGSEPEYKPELWNNNPKLLRSHNCYAYSMNKREAAMSGKAQPGYFSGYPPLSVEDYDCDKFFERMKKDNPSIKKTTFAKRCGKGSYKVFLALDTKPEDRDYHYFKQDRSGFWSHKPGGTAVTDLDASGKKIKNPLLANRSYENYQYTEPCFFLCVDPRMSKTHSKRQRSHGEKSFYKW